MARKSLPQQQILADFRDPPKPTKPRLPPGVVEQKVYDITLAESRRTGRPRKLIRTDWYVRIRFREYPGGPRIPVSRKCAKNATDAKEVRAALKEEKVHGAKSLKHSRMTWAELSKHFREHYLPGYASPKPIIVSLNALEEFFGTRRARRAAMPAVFGDEARRYIDKHNLGSDDPLFPYKSVKGAWGTLKRRAGVEDLRIKDLRRTGATRLHRAGMPFGEVSFLLGHTTIEMTKE